MTRLRRHTLIVGLALLLLATGSAHGLEESSQALSKVICAHDLTLGEDGFLINDRTWVATEPDPASDNNTVAEKIAADGETDLGVTKTADPDPVVAGETLTYTLVVSNGGPVTATGVIVTDTLPTSLNLQSATPSQGACGGKSTVVCCLDTVGISGTATVNLVATVAPSARATLTNTTEVSADQPDVLPGNNAYTATTTVTAEADLSVTKTDDTDPVVAGEALAYTLTVANNGPSDATGVTLTDTLPSGILLVSAIPDQGIYDRNTGIWAVGDLVDGESAKLILVFMVDSSTRGTLSNAVEVSANQPDPISGNNTCTETTTVNAEANLAVTKTDDPDPVVAGDPLTYTLTVTNSGLSDATGVTVTDTLPSGVTFDSASYDQGTYSSGIGVWAVGDLADGESATLFLFLTVAPSTRGALANIAEVSAAEDDPTPDDNADTESTIVNAEADLGVTKLDDPNLVVAGETLTYTLIITNNGPSNATGVSAIDDLPDDVTLFSALPSQGTCSGFDPVTCDIGQVTSRANVTVSLGVTVTSPLTNGSILSNVATVSGYETDHYGSNDSAEAQTTVQSSPVMTIAKLDDPDPVEAGSALLYTLVITNSGNENATPVTIAERYDRNVSFFCSDPGSDPDSGDQEWTLPIVEVGNPETIDIVVTVASPLPVGTVLTNQATLYSDQTAPVTVTEFTDVTSASELTLDTIEVPDPVQAGETLVYVITYQNFGTAPATGLIITATYDSRINFRGADPLPDDGDNVWQIGDLPVNQSGYISITASVDTPLANGTVLTTYLTVGSDHTSPQMFVETTTVRSAPDLAFTVIDHPNPVEAGNPLTYTLRYTNTGNADATQVVITATLDSRISLDSSTPVWHWNVGTITGEVGHGEIITHANVPFSILDGSILEFTAQLKDAEGDLLGRTAQTTVHSFPDLFIEKVGEGHQPHLFSPGKQMAYIVTYGNAGYKDVQDVTITTTLPTGTTYEEVGYGWQTSGDGIYIYPVGPLTATSTGHTITFTVRHTDTPGISAPEFNTPFIIDGRGVAGEDIDPNNNTTSVHIGVPDLLISDLSVEPGPASVQENVPTTFTFTITLMNQGTGMACNPDGMGDFYVDVFTTPVDSYPCQCNSEICEVCDPVAAGIQPSPVVITRVITPRAHSLVFYAKVDNHPLHPYGLVPESDEMNNLAVWPPRVYLPVVLRNWNPYYEENDHWLDAYGPLTPGRTYLAYPDDEEDYYYFELSGQATVNVSVTDFAPTSSNGTVMLYGPAVGDERGELIDYYGPPGHSSMPLGPHSLGGGKYYIRVYADKGHSTTQLYRLTVTY